MARSVSCQIFLRTISDIDVNVLSDARSA